MCSFFKVSAFFFSAVSIVMAEMSVEEKVGQLFVIPVAPRLGEGHKRDVERALQELYINKVITKAVSLEEHKKCLEWIGANSLVFSDAEWGLGMRLQDALSYPKNLTLGALKETQGIYEMGREIGFSLREIKVDVNLSPVVDVNTKSKNPIIHMRSFSSDPLQVGEKGKAMMQGLRDGGVIPCAKHFPGHGNVVVDSHVGLPEMEGSLEEIESIDLFPFQILIDAGVPMIMTGHLSSKALTGKKQFPCGMSKEIIEGLLRKKMGFRGVIISDAMNMKGIANDYAPEEAAIAYLQAGHDLLLYGDHIGPNIDEILQEMVPRAYFAVLEKVKKGELYIDDKVERILKLKEKKNLRRELFRSSITRVGPDYATPLGGTIRYKAYGEDRGFKEELTQYGHIGNEGVLVLAIFDKNAISVEEIHTLAKEEKMILALFDSPYLAMGFPQEAMWLIGYEKEQEVIEAMAEAIFGLLKPQGQIPIQFK